MIRSLAHTCFIVSDLEGSIAFYRDALGLKQAFDFKDSTGKRNGIYLHVGDRSFIELFQGSPVCSTVAHSYSHICLEVDDIRATVAQLQRKGINVGPISLEIDNTYQAWFSDPDGNRIELHQYTPESWQAPSLAS